MALRTPYDLMVLSDVEMRLAEVVGRERDEYANSRRYTSRHSEEGKRHSSLQNHILGVRSELAIARLLHLQWEPHVGTIEGVDVGRDVEVRARRMGDPRDIEQADGISAGLLTLGARDKGKGDKAFVLVHAYRSMPDNALCALGWHLGSEVLKKKWWQADPDIPAGVCRLPHSELRSIPDLIAFLEFRDEQRYDERLESLLAERG